MPPLCQEFLFDGVIRGLAMKTCPFCDASNDDDAFYCRECDKPLSDVPREPASPGGESSLSLMDDTAPPKPSTRRPEGGQRPTRPMVHGDRRGSQGSEEFGHQSASVKSGAKSLAIFLFILVLLLGGALAYLILVQEALKNKAYFNEQLRKTTEASSASIRFLESELESVREQRNQLIIDLSKSKQEYSRDVEHLQSRIKELVEGKIPGTHPVRTGETTTIMENDITYAVEFSVTDLREHVLRYRVTLENTQQSPLTLAPMDLIVYNENGLQIGISFIAFLDHLGPKQILPGEAKVTMGSIRLTPAGNPSFFVVVPQ